MNVAPAGWSHVRFGDMAASVTDRVDDPATAGVDRYVGLEHLDSGSLRIARWGAPSDVEATKLRFRAGDVIFGRRRAYQKKVALADFDGICSAHALVLRAKPEVVLSQFLPLFMQSDLFFDRALSISVGSLSPTINWKDLARQEFDMPPINEQRRLADLLWAVEAADRKRAGLEAAMGQLERAIIEERFSSPSRVRPLGSVVPKIIAGKSLVGIGEPAAGEEYGVLKVSAVGASGFAPGENKRLLEQSEFRPEVVVRAGDFLVTRSNTRELVGRACIVPADFPNLMLSDKTLRLELDTKRVAPRFLLAAFASRAVRAQIESRATGTGGAMKNLSQPDFLSLQIPLPELEMQERLVRSLRAITDGKEAGAASAEASERLRRALTRELLSGRKDST